MWGGVGRGKSMLMDLFHDTLAIPEKRRVHFHAFMLEVHDVMRDVRKGETGDPIPQVAARIAKGLRVLAFDEMVVNNSADAMIMSRLFTALIRDHGLVIVTTSNRAPKDLYKDGLNREHFLPFIALIEGELDVLTLNGPVDYRLERLTGIATWHMPLGEAATQRVREVFFRLTDYPPEDAANVPRWTWMSAAAACCMCPRASRAWPSSASRSCAARRAGLRIISPWRGITTR
jgi:cell division protein ZapE